MSASIFHLTRIIAAVWLIVLVAIGRHETMLSAGLFGYIAAGLFARYALDGGTR